MARDALQVRSGGAVEVNRKLVEIFEEKIQGKLAEIWGEEEKDSDGVQGGMR